MQPPSSRNAACPCGSGKRYKDCHGALGETAQPWIARALAQMQLREFDAAEESLRRAEAVAPEDLLVHANLGTLYVRQKRDSEAETALQKALALVPDEPYVLTLLTHSRQRRCEWQGLAELHRRVASALEAERIDRRHAPEPFPVLSMPTTPAQQLAVARRYARELAPTTPASAPQIAYAAGERLRVGVVSSDFRPHATYTLVMEFLERIDRRRLEMFGYGILARNTGRAGRRAEGAFEHFSDVSALPVAEIAQRIRDDRIGILIDLNGYTRNARPGVFALRPAPVQINAIGFQATLGAPWYDYIFTDRFSLPESLARFYSERPLYMPQMAFPSDTTRLPPGPPPGRVSLGLPVHGLVFCCFNNAYKILPEVFAIWMRLLRAVPRSVLWLLETSAAAKTNLAREAQAAGVEPGRLLFAPRVGVSAHVARQVAADLFLDTYPYGAHTTANDALLAGLPLVTCVGETLASRIAGSQLHAIGLPELVTESLEAYEALALKLATEPGLLRSYRARLAANRSTYPLFDMARYARDFEHAMLRVWKEKMETGSA